jgi:type 1 fimbriae regulatory protein FimB/type 1 fimbriae regulatory protein FimE
VVRNLNHPFRSARPLENCAYNVRYSESRFPIRGIFCEKSEDQVPPLNHRKSDSYTAPAAERRSAGSGVSNPEGVDRLQDAARKHSRYGHRDATAILIAYRHGLRASELCELNWNMIELNSGRIHVRRAKNGVDSTHPLTGKEIRALRQLRRENLQSRYVFNTERGGPVTRDWFLKMVRRTGELAKLAFPIHPHRLRRQGNSITTQSPIFAYRSPRLGGHEFLSSCAIEARTVSGEHHGNRTRQSCHQSSFDVQIFSLRTRVLE